MCLVRFDGGERDEVEASCERMAAAARGSQTPSIGSFFYLLFISFSVFLLCICDLCCCCHLRCVFLISHPSENAIYGLCYSVLGTTESVKLLALCD